jgi:hypothetical protein
MRFRGTMVDEVKKTAQIARGCVTDTRGRDCPKVDSGWRKLNPVPILYFSPVAREIRRGASSSHCREQIRQTKGSSPPLNSTRSDLPGRLVLSFLPKGEVSDDAAEKRPRSGCLRNQTRRFRTLHS